MPSTNDLLLALKNRQHDDMARLLAAKPDLANSMHESGISILLMAAYHRDAVAVDLIKKYRTDFSIFEASALGEVDVLKNKIAQKPALVNAIAADGFHALGLACFFNQAEAVQLLLKAGAAVNLVSKNAMQVAPIHSAAASRNLDLLKILVTAGADVNAAQSNGVTPLHTAAHLNLREMVIYLLKNGAAKDSEMKDGRKPIDFAKENEQLEIIKLLQ